MPIVHTIPSGFQVAVLILLAQVIIAIASRSLAHAIGWPMSFFNLLGNLVFLFVAAVVLVSIPSTRRFLAAQFAKPSRAALVEAVLVGFAKVAAPFGILGALAFFYLCMSPTSDLVAALGVTLDRAAEDEKYFSSLGLLQGIFLAIVLGPIMEEVIFRGLLYRAWERQWSWFPAMIATAIVFGLAHPGHMVSAAIGSIVYTCLLRRTGTLWAPIVAHAIFNAIVAWPLAGHVLFVRTAEEVTRMSSWWLEFGAFAFLVLALPLYVWSARDE